MRNLTPKQKKILDFIISFINKKEYSPSLEEIAMHFKKSVPTIHQHVEALKNKGFLDKEEKVSRGISPLKNDTEIFLLGTIAAGKPVEPLENPEPIKISSDVVKSSGNYYALKVKGDSMIEEGILEGDTIIVKHQNTAQDGDTVVAITEDGATLKKFRIKNGKIILEPRNRRLKNNYPKKLEIRGKFVGLIRGED